MYPALIIAFIAAWAALYFIWLRPWLESFRLTAAIYAKIDAAESAWGHAIMLRLAGLKVAILAFLTSAAPIIAVGYDHLSGTNWETIKGMHPFDLVMLAAGVILPMVMAAMHNHALATAQADTPADPVAAAAAPLPPVPALPPVPPAP